MRGEVIISYNVVSLSLPRSSRVYFHTRSRLTISTFCVFWIGVVMQAKITHFFMSVCTREPMGRLICCSLARPILERRWLSDDIVVPQMKLLCGTFGRGGCPTSKCLFLTVASRCWTPPPSDLNTQIHTSTRNTHNPLLWHALILSLVCPEVWLKVFYKLSLLLLG